MVGGTMFHRRTDSAWDFQRLGPQSLWQSKRCSHTASKRAPLTTPSLLSRGTRL